jgi:para-aminobenzoate synthetase component 1
MRTITASHRITSPTSIASIGLSHDEVRPDREPLRYRERQLPGWRAPEDALVHLDRGQSDVVWVDAGLRANAGLSILGWGHRRLQSTRIDREASAAALATLRHPPLPHPTGRLGWYGWLGYGTTATVLGLDAGSQDPVCDPEADDLAFLEVDRALVFHHDSGTVTAQSIDYDADWLRDVERNWRRRWPPTAPCGPAHPTAPATWSSTDAAYRALIHRCQAAIADGEAFVLCPTMRATVGSVHEDPVTIYRRLRRDSPTARAMYARIGATAVLSASPERFLTVDASRRVSSAPIKGTRPRAVDPIEDAHLADELAASEKERAENVMIVDLVRSDLGQVCQIGSVTVPELFAVHSFRHVHQLQSTVTGVLRDDVHPLDAVMACFPPGSMTGAPKRRAVDLLAEWEGLPRGVYSGVMGSIGFDGQVELAVVIRTIVITAGRAAIGAGGGITADSEPAMELDEVKIKAAALLAVLGSR